MRRLINENRRQQFAREFPWLDQIPGGKYAGRIEVQHVDLGLLRDAGTFDEHPCAGFSTLFYIVCDGSIQELRTRFCGGDTFSCDPGVPVNGEQIFQISSRPPDFIVKVGLEFDSYGENPIRVCTIYRTNRFDWETYFEREVKPRLKETEST